MRFAVPQRFAASQNSKRIVGPRRGLPSLYKGKGFPATETFTGEIGFVGRRCRNQNGEATKYSRYKAALASMGSIGGYRVMWRIINTLYEEYCQARLDEMLRLDAGKR